MLKSKVNGVHIFRPVKILWQLLGKLPPTQHKTRYRIFSFVIHVAVNLCYPLHLLIGLFYCETANDIFKNMAITSICCASSVKDLSMWWTMKEVHKIDDIISKLDRRIVEPAHIKYYHEQVQANVMTVFYICCIAYVGCSVTSETATIIAGIVSEWRLMYPAYFPFDAYGSGFNYFLAHLYQFLGVTIQIFVILAHDSYATMTLALLAGHAHLLGARLSNIGYDARQSLEENNAVLLACIEDYQILLDFRRTIEQIISIPVFVQLIASGFNICISILYLIFFANDAFSLIYYTVYCTSMALQIFPCCYYGTVFSMQFDKLTYTIFSSNWMVQNKIFKQNLRILAELTLRWKNIMAAGIFRIDLGAFFATCKSAYSLFSVVVHIK